MRIMESNSNMNWLRQGKSPSVSRLKIERRDEDVDLCGGGGS